MNFVMLYVVVVSGVENIEIVESNGYWMEVGLCVWDCFVIYVRIKRVMLRLNRVVIERLLEKVLVVYIRGWMRI